MENVDQLDLVDRIKSGSNVNFDKVEFWPENDIKHQVRKVACTSQLMLTRFGWARGFSSGKL